MGKFDRTAPVMVLVAILVAGCASTSTDHAKAPDTVALHHVRSFSGHTPGATLPPGWQPWILSRFKRPTEYRLVSQQGRTVVHAKASASASGLTHPLALDSATYPLLNWRWKVDALIRQADNTKQHLEDAPVRLVVSFDGDMEKLSPQDRTFFSNIHLLTGQQLPYATLMYIWENRALRETVIPNRHTSRIRMIVAESGRDRLGQWQEVTRNIVEDYRRAFGEEPGRITAVGLMTDTDNTGDSAHAWYGDIMFTRSPSPTTAAR